jgi:hypothetical protein
MSNGKKDVPDPKRPHATLDLKATEVTPPPADGTAKATSAGAGTADASATSKASTVTPDGGRATGKVGETKASDQKPGGPAPTGAGAKPEASAAKATPRSGGRLFSHLLAGIAGGVLAIAVADWAAPHLGIATPSQILQVRTAELQERLTALERKAATGDVAAQLKAAEDRVAALEGRADKIAGAQTQLATSTKTQLDKLSTQSLAASTEQRLKALDERLELIAKAASEGKGGGTAQVAAVTGKLAEVQGTLSQQIDEVRKSVPQNVEPRLAKLDEQAGAASDNAKRLDTDLNTLRTDAARLNQRVETIKADSDRASATLTVLKEEAARLTSEFAEVKATVAAQVKGGVGEAITPVTTKLSALEQGLQSVVKSEEDRRMNAERIVVSLELANLKRLIDSGQGYAGGLADVRKAAGGKLNLEALDRFKDSGVPTIVALQRSFRPVANAMVDAAVTPAEGGAVDKIVAGAKSVVRVRNLNPSPDDKSVEAVVARMQTALADGHLGDVLAQASDLPEAALAPARDWLDNVKARHAVDRAIGDIESQLKTSLTQAPAPAGQTAATPAPGGDAGARLPAPGSIRPPERTDEPAGQAQPQP